MYARKRRIVIIGGFVRALFKKIESLTAIVNKT